MEILILIAGALFVICKLYVGGKPMSLGLASPLCANLEPLCPSCIYVYKRKGFDGQESISCTFGGKVARVTFKVRECSGYKSSTAEPRARVAGFIRPDEIKNNVTVIRIAS
jgi:hypothetical protein